jgi:hypothetical protein
MRRSAPINNQLIMKSSGKHQIDSFLKSCAIAILIASLLLAGRNTPVNNNKSPARPPVHSIRDHNLQVGNA